MALKNIPDSGYADDDGSADPELASALAAYALDRGAEGRVLAALAKARLLVPVVALLGEAETGPDGLRRDKTSDMAVPTLKGPGGRRALPAFTSTETLSRWDAEARPVAVPLRQALAAVISEGADTLALDLAGPVPFELSGRALLAAAEGRGDTDPASDPAVAAALSALLEAEPAVLRAHLLPSADADATLALVLTDEVDAPQRVAQAVAADATLRARLHRGLTLAVVPADTALQAPVLYAR